MLARMAVMYNPDRATAPGRTVPDFELTSLDGKRKFTAEDMGQGSYQKGLGDTRYPFDQDMLAGKDSDQSLIHYLTLPNDDLGHFLPGLCQDLL